MLHHRAVRYLHHVANVIDGATIASHLDRDSWGSCQAVIEFDVFPGHPSPLPLNHPESEKPVWKKMLPRICWERNPEPAVLSDNHQLPSEKRGHMQADLVMENMAGTAVRES